MNAQPWSHLPDTTPVIVGVGVATQQGTDLPEGLDAFELMIRAAQRAGEDAGCPALLSQIGAVAVPEGSWSHANAPGQVAAVVGSPGARTVVLQAGIPQQTLLNEAYTAILRGEVRVALIVGGERAARRTGVELAADAGPVPWPRPPDELRAPAGEIVSPIEIDAGLWSPVQQYALIDSALRHHEHRTIAEHQDEIAQLWSGFSQVASIFEHAAHPGARSVEFLRDPGPENRMVSFPYNRWHCSQMHVDQAAGILVSSLGAARALGVDLERVVFPLVALESSASVAVIRRRDLHRWPAMQLLGTEASTRIGRPLDRVDHVELYSCFPAAVRVQQRELGLPLDGVPTITGGETFAGGPWNNFVLQATAAMIDRVRADRGTLGMVSTVSGFLHKPGLALYSTEPGPEPVEPRDLATEAAAATPTLPIATGYRGPATIAACTVAVERSGERRLVTIVDTPAGERWPAFSDSSALIDLAVADELIGQDISVDAFAITDPSTADGWAG